LARCTDFWRDLFSDADEGMKGLRSWRGCTEQLLSIMFKNSIFALGVLGLTLTAWGADDYVPMKIIQTAPVTLSHRATDLGITLGKVIISLQVDEQGKLSDYLVTAYSHPLLAESAVQAVKKWSYEPAWIHGHPHSATVDLTFEFESRGLVVVDMTINSYVEMRAIALRPGSYAYGAHKMRDLDRIPNLIKVIQPLYDVGSVKSPTKVSVQFYIDEEGRVRLPAVSRAMNDANEPLAASALQAVSQWRFEPPLAKGSPVLVAASQEFTFQPAP
jgi:TonB family protein